MCGHSFTYNSVILPSHCPICGAPLRAAPCPYPAPHVPPRPWGPWTQPYSPWPPQPQPYYGPFYTSNQVML